MALGGVEGTKLVDDGGWITCPEAVGKLWKTKARTDEGELNLRILKGRDLFQKFRQLFHPLRDCSSRECFTSNRGPEKDKAIRLDLWDAKLSDDVER